MALTNNASARQSSVALAWADKATGALRLVRFDVVTQETREAIAEITEHSVEEGADVTDHHRPKTKTVSIVGYVSNKPLPSNPGAAQLLTQRRIALAVPKPPRARPAQVPLAPRMHGPPPMQKNLSGLVKAGVGALSKAIGAGPDAPTATLAKVPDYIANYSPSVYAPSGGDVPDRAKDIYDQLIEAWQLGALISLVSKLGEVPNMMIEKINVPRTVESGNGAEIQVDLKQVRFAKSQTVAAPAPAEVSGRKEVSLGTQAAIKADPRTAEKIENISLAWEITNGMFGGRR